MKVEKIENKDRQNSNVLIVIVSFLLLVSIAMSVMGLVNGKKEVDVVGDEAPEETTIDFKSDIEDGSLSDMFQEEFSDSSKGGRGYDYNDPFKEICAPVDGSEPATSSFTVCQPK